MAIPDFQTLMLPFLRLLADRQNHRMTDLLEALSTEFDLSSDDRKELVGSGQQTVMRNRAGWARTYLKKAGMLEYPQRGVFRITERGLKTLASKPGRIDIKFLDQYPEFVAFRKSKSDDVTPEPVAPPTATPEETLEAAFESLRSQLESDLLDQVMDASPEFFERLVVDVLVRMGYGGTIKDAGKAIGKSGDGGIDGIINEDKLGLDVIYVQAKRWDPNNKVGRPEVQKFVGALQGKNAHKGVFITTSSFSGDAREYAEHVSMRVVLVDGSTLARLMVDHNVGVSAVRSYEVKRVDEDYFIED